MAYRTDFQTSFNQIKYSVDAFRELKVQLTELQYTLLNTNLENDKERYQEEYHQPHIGNADGKAVKYCRKGALHGFTLSK